MADPSDIERGATMLIQLRYCYGIQCLLITCVLGAGVILIKGVRNGTSPHENELTLADPETRVFSFAIGKAFGQNDGDDPDIVTAVIRRRLNCRFPGMTKVASRREGFTVYVNASLNAKGARIRQMCCSTGLLKICPLATIQDSLLHDTSAIRGEWDIVRNHRVAAEWIRLGSWENRKNELDALGAYYYRRAEGDSRILLIKEYGFLIPWNRNDALYTDTPEEQRVITILLDEPGEVRYTKMMSRANAKRRPGEFPITLALDYDSSLLGICKDGLSAKRALRFDVSIDRVQGGDVIATVMGGQLFCSIEFLGATDENGDRSNY